VSRAALVRSALAACSFVACGGAASDLSPKEAAAERAYAAGRYAEAAERFGEAAATAPRARDREEARYRQAVSLERAGQPAEAHRALAELLRTFPAGARAPRALYDLAQLELSQGNSDEGNRMLDELVRKYPDSGVAPAALRRYLAALAAQGEPAVRAYLEALAPRVAKTELSQYVGYEHARSHERQGALDAAREEYLRIADRYPYPRGLFWDDALYRAGDIDVTLGAPRDAVAVFERLLAEREPSFMEGSYERGHYAEAAFRVAELHRDVLHEPSLARKEFETIWSAYPTSRLRDDAAWSAARIAAESGDQAGACRLLRALGAERPDSRYVACAPALCSSFRPPSRTGSCHEYLLRDPPSPRR
jgi:TolA-binding protein